MPRKKKSKKRDFSLENMQTGKLKSNAKVKPFNASKRIQNKDYIAQALWECLVSNDSEAFKEILKTHLELVNKDEFAKKTGISRRTLFRLLSREGNPTLENISKIVHQVCA